MSDIICNGCSEKFDCEVPCSAVLKEEPLPASSYQSEKEFYANREPGRINNLAFFNPSLRVY